MVVAMMDPHRLKPIKGKPTMLYPSMITAFNFHHLEHSILEGRYWDLQWMHTGNCENAPPPAPTHPIF